MPSALLLCALPLLALAQPPVYRPRLPTQMHGFNSLGAWPQLLAKHQRLLKIDLGLATKASCEAFSTLGQPGRGSAADCFTQGGGAYCCLAMSGDTGSRPDLLDPFNTSYDLVSLLDDDAMQALLPHGAPSPQPQMLIALDFGGSPSACLSGCPAAPLVRGFLTAAYAAIQRRNLSVAFALDSGIASWYEELDAACAGGGCSAADAALAAMPWVAEGGAGWPAGGASPRTRIVNDDYDSFQQCCASACWQHAPTAFPWQWYEQTGQADYEKMLAWWGGCASLPPALRAAPSTALTMVSNEAPEMAEVFSAPSGALGRGLNAPIPGSAGQTLPLTVAVPLLGSGGGSGGGGAPERALLLLAVLPRAAGLALYSLPHSGASPPGAPADALDSALLPALGAASPPVALAAAAVAGGDAGDAPSPAPALLLLALADGTLASAALDPATGRLLRFAACASAAPSGGWCTWRLRLEPGAALLSAALLCSAAPPLPLPATVSALNATCTVAALVATAGGGAEVRLAGLGEGGGGAGSGTPVAPRALAVDKGGSLAVLWAGAGAAWEGLVVLASRAPPLAPAASAPPAAARALPFALRANVSAGVEPRWDGARAYQYAAYVSLDAGSGVVGVVPPVAAGVVPARVGLGSTPRLAALRLRGANHVLLVSSDGQCSEGQYVNNADMSHCLLPLPASDANLFYAAFQTVPYTLQYDYAPLASWRRLATGALPYPHLGICNPAVMHGKFELGASGAAALFPWAVVDALPGGGNASAAVEVGLVVAHEPAPQGALTAPQWLLCGLPTTKEGLVWSSFQLSPPPF